VGGLRIWWLLRTRLGRAVSLFRTTGEWVAAEATRGGRRLGPSEREALARIDAQLVTVDGPAIQEARALIQALLKTGIKLEQERY
jgi:hypothetical protein